MAQASAVPEREQLLEPSHPAASSSDSISGSVPLASSSSSGPSSGSGGSGADQRDVSIARNKENPQEDSGARDFFCCAHCTRHQKRLMILLLLWVSGGLYMYMMRPWGKDHEYYTIVEAMYVMAQIVTTVGYGDYTPVTDGGFLFTSMYVLTAVLVLSSIVSTITETVIQTEDALIKNALGKVSITNIKNIKRTITNVMPGKPRGAGGQEAGREQPEEQPQGAGGTGAEEEQKGRVGFAFKNMHPASMGFLRAATIWSLFVLAGTLFFCHYPGEDLDYVEAMYMSVITLTTVGFGDKTPSTTGGMVFATYWMLFGVAAFANMVGKFAAFCMAQDRLRTLDRDTLLDIQNDSFYRKCHPADEEGGSTRGTVTRADFVLFMMKQMGILDKAVVEQLSNNFDDLDRDRSGFLDQDDIAQHLGRIQAAML